MTEEKLLATLTERVGKTSFSQQTLGRYLKLNPLAEGTEPDDAYWDKAVAFIGEMQGQFNADMAATVEDFKKNYKPETTPPNNAQNKDGENDLLKRIEQLEQQNAANAKNASATALRTEATAKGKTLKVVNEAIWADAVEAVKIGENDTADDVVSSAKKIYEQRLRRYMGEGAAPYGSSGRQGAGKEAEEAAKSKRDALKKKMQARGRLPKSE